MNHKELRQALSELRDLGIGEWMLCQRVNGNVVAALYGGLPWSAFGKLGVLAQPWIRSRRNLSKHRNMMRFLRRPTRLELYQFGIPNGRPVAKVVVDTRLHAPYFEPLWN